MGKILDQTLITMLAVAAGVIIAVAFLAMVGGNQPGLFR